MDTFTKQRKRALKVRLHKLQRGVLLMRKRMGDVGYNSDIIGLIIQRIESEIQAILDEDAHTKN